MNLDDGNCTAELMQRCAPVHRAGRTGDSRLNVGAVVLEGDRPAGAGTQNPVGTPAAGLHFLKVIHV